jgi:hypothetical protein
MAESNAVRTKQDAIITITDGTTTYTVAKEVGDFNASVPGYNTTSVLDRGLFGADPNIRKGDEQPVTGGFSIYLRDLPNSTNLTLLDLCMELSGTVAAGMTTTTTNTEVRTWTLVYTIDGTWNGESDQVMTFYKSVLRASITEGDPSSVAVTFTSYQPFPTIT